MSNVKIITHFSEPTWPVVNKLAGITRCLGVEMHHCPDMDTLRTVMAASLENEVLFFTDENLLHYVSELEKNLGDRHIEVALFVNAPLPSVAKSISQSKIVRFLLGIESVASCGRDLSILIKKFVDKDILDLNKYLSFGSVINHKLVDSSRAKAEAVESVYGYIQQLGDPTYSHPYGEYASLVSQMVDELLLNAVFDANPRFKTTDRSKPYSLKDDEKIDLAWGYDGEYFGVSVRDPFGQFECETIMKYVASNRNVQEIAASHSAGLGLKIIFEKAHKVVANVSQGKVTEVIVLVRFENRMLEFEKRKKSFYYFSNDIDKASRSS